MPEVFNSQSSVPASPLIEPAVDSSIPVTDQPPGQAANIPITVSDQAGSQPLAQTGTTQTVSTSQPHVDNSSPIITRSVNDFSQMMSDSKPSRNPFRAFLTKPVSTFFDSKDSQEKILLLLRQHPITQIKWVLVAVVLIFVPFLLSFVNVLGFLPFKFHVVAAIAWYLMVLGFSLESFLDWFFNCYIITDQRIIDVDFTSLLFKNVSSAKFEKIEDVNFTSSGTLGAIFDYGNVLIQTAAAVDEFQFENVPYPSRVTSFINDLLTEMERQNGRALN